MSFLKVPWKQTINAGKVAVVGKALYVTQVQENKKKKNILHLCHKCRQILKHIGFFFSQKSVIENC
jgi:hypothetical protein